MIETKPFLDMTRVCGDHYEGNAEEVASRDACHLQAVEVISAYLREDTLQRSSQTAFPDGSEGIRLDLGRHEEGVPARGPNLAIERKSIDRSNHAPVLRVGVALQPQPLAHERLLLDQNRANLNS